VQVTATYPIGKPSQSLVPTVADPASVYSTTTGTFSGQVFLNGGQAGAPAITRLIADDLTLTGTPPYSIGRFDFSMCNLNTVAVSARPRIRFYLDNAGTPGTLITGFSFSAITLNASNCSTFFANVAPFSITSSLIWAGVTFDNSGGTATAAQMNNFGMGIYPVPDTGTSADTFWLTTAAGSFLANNPAGAATNVGGSPLANFGWDFRSAATISTVARANTDPRQTSGTAQWTVTTTGGSITSLAASNFTLTGTAATGSSITSVVANNLSPTSTNWTVTATIGTTTGTLGLNWANATGLNTNVSNTLPFAGETYNVVVPTAASVSVGGRVIESNGNGIARARVTVTALNGASRYVSTNQFGYFRFDELSAGETYILTVNSRRYQFERSAQLITANDDFTEINFVAVP
jgi:Carboxypeptidase regulatory-like domain